MAGRYIDGWTIKGGREIQGGIGYKGRDGWVIKCGREIQGWMGYKWMGYKWEGLIIKNYDNA